MSQEPREWNSGAYHELSEPQLLWGKRVLSWLSLRGDETVLDAGCGTGRVTAELLDLLPRGRVVAVDFSENMLHTAREHLRPRFAERVAFVEADLQFLPFDGAFDGIFGTASFHWVRDHDRLFRALRQALRPGGWLCAQCGGHGNIAKLLARAAVLSSQPPYAQYLSAYGHPWEFATAETAAERLRRAGFIEIETDLEEAPASFQTSEEYREFLSTVVLRTHLERIPSNEAREQFLEALARQAAKDDPPFQLDYCRLNLRARRPQ
jgi:trans-aconitate 2-methyltransferase